MERKAKAKMDRCNSQVRKNRRDLRRLIDIAACLGAMEDVAFLHPTHAADLEEMFAELCRLLLLRSGCRDTRDSYKRLERSGRVPAAAGLLSCCAGALRAEILAEAVSGSAPFFSVRVDGWLDGGGRPVSSVTLRFVDAGAGVVRERLLGFHRDEEEEEDCRRAARALLDRVRAELSGAGGAMAAKLVAHSYDGRAVCAHELPRLGAGVREAAPHALLVNSYAHMLPGRRQEASCVPEARVFLAELTGISAFLAGDPERFLLLLSCWEELYPGRPFMEMSSLRLKNPQLTCVVLSLAAGSYDELYELVLHVVRERKLKHNSRGFADAIVLTMESFQFAFLLFTYQQVFPQIQRAFDSLRRCVLDVAACRGCVSDLIRHVRERASDAAFLAVYRQASDRAEYPGEALRRKLAARGVQMAPDQDPREHFKSLYRLVLDCVAVQLQDRFSSLEDLGFLALLDPARFPQMARRFPSEALACLTSGVYGALFDPRRLRAELGRFWADGSLHGGGGEGGGAEDHRRLEGWLRSLRRRKSMAELYKFVCLVATLGVTPVVEGDEGSRMERVEAFTSRMTARWGLQRALALLYLEKDALKAAQKEERWYDAVTALYAAESGRESEFIPTTPEQWWGDLADPEKPPLPPPKPRAKVLSVLAAHNRKQALPRNRPEDKKPSERRPPTTA